MFTLAGTSRETSISTRGLAIGTIHGRPAVWLGGFSDQDVERHRVREMATGLTHKTKLNGNQVTVYDREWPLYFCSVKTTMGRYVWDLLSYPALPGGGKKAGEGITIVHPDTGYVDHPELLKGRRLDIARSRNFLDPGLPALDPLTERFDLHPGHGTATASVLMSEPGHPNDPVLGPPEFPTYNWPLHISVSGYAPKAKLIPCRVTDSVVLWGDSVPALTRAIYYATALATGTNADPSIGVISVSLGCSPGSQIDRNALARALLLARTRGIVVCAAAAQLPTPEHKSPTGPAYPGRDWNVICCAACDSNGAMLYEGFYGRAVDITVPGANIWKAHSLNDASGVAQFSVQTDGRGTSYATAFLAGACALWQAHHGRSNLIRAFGANQLFDLFRWALFETCDRPSGWDTSRFGHGILDVEALLRKDLSTITLPELQAWARRIDREQ